MRPRVAGFVGDVAAWADAQPDVRVVLLIGSQARSDAPADEYSDVDLVLLVDDPPRYLRDDGWLRALGEPLLTFLEPTAVGNFEERRVLFGDGLEVDFSFAPTAVARARSPEVDAVLARGCVIVYDSIGVELPAPAAAPSAAAPSQPRLEQLSHDFWYHVLWAAKKLRRGELLIAKQVCDCYLTERLVQLVRWRGHGRETWHGYRFFERWAGSATIAALGPTFARYNDADIARALRATAELFGDVEEDVVRRFGLTAPVDRATVLAQLDTLLS